jgi:hypothetical protein
MIFMSKKNFKWFLLIFMCWLPSLVFHQVLPLHLIIIRPVNGLFLYWLFGILVILLIAIPTWITFIVLFNKTNISKFKKVIFGFLIMLSFTNISILKSKKRFDYHMANYKIIENAKIIKIKDYFPKYQVIIEYERKGNIYNGVLDLYFNEFDLNQKNIDIYVSMKDPRLYMEIDRSKELSEIFKKNKTKFR